MLGTPSIHTASRLRGMVNVGNTCYGNALLAALSRVPRLRGWLSAHTAQVASNVQHDRLQCAMCCLTRDFQGLTEANQRTPLIPETMLHVNLWNDNFVAGAQHDAEEAFQYLFAACDKCNVKQLKVDLHTPPDEELPQTVRDATPYFQIFGGVYKNTIHCTTCNCTSSRLEPFTTLQLELLPGVKTLHELIASRFKPEPCDNDFICNNDGCNARGTHTKRCHITRWPQLLVVHLKRWRFNTRTQMRSKIDDFVDFPVTYNTSSDTTYTLRSIVVHRGKANAGHYVAFVRDEGHGWLYYDDARTPAATPLSVVMRQCPYMLFYEKRS